MRPVINPERKKLLDLAQGKDCLVVGPLGTYEYYRNGPLHIWDFHYLSGITKSLAGIDICEDLVKLAQADGWTNLIYADAENFDLGRKFDVIFTADLIEHLGRPLDFLLCASRHLRPGGVIIAETPNPFATNICLGALLRGEVATSSVHTCWVDGRNAIELGKRAGLNCQVEFYSPISYYSRGQWLRTHLYKAFGKLRPRLGTKAVYVYTPQLVA